MKRLTTPIKIHGGKYYLASRIAALCPPHLHYVEPFAGGLSVLLAKNPEGVSEVVGDCHWDLTNFWRVLQGGDSFRQFQRLCEATPFSEAEWSDADLEFLENPEHHEEFSDRVVRAWRFFVHCRQSLAGRMESFAPLSRNRVRRGMNEQAAAWLSAVEGLPAVHERLKRVVVLCRPALEVIRSQDGPHTLQFLDPPYYPATRASKEVYEHEMSEDDHGELLSLLGSKEFRGKFLLSGYRNELYDDWAGACGWHRKDFDLPNNAAGGKSKKRMVESLWANFPMEEQ